MEGKGSVGGGGMGSRAVGLGGDVGGGVARVAHISNVARVGIGNVVLDGLDAAIGKVDLVLASHSLAVGGLVLVEAGAGVLIGNTVLVGVRLGLVVRLLVMRGGMGSRGVVGAVLGDNGGHEGSEDEETIHDGVGLCGGCDSSK